MVKFVNAKYASVLPDPSVGAAMSVDWEAPASARAFAAEDASFVKDIDGFLESFVADMDHQKIRSALATIMQISARGNQYIQDNKVDNALLVNEPSRAAHVVLNTINLVYVLAALVHPFMPSTSDEILAQLNAAPRSIPNSFDIALLPGHIIGTAAHLFSKIDTDNIAKWRGEFGGDAKPAVALAAAAPQLSRKQADKAKKEAKAQAEALKAAVPRTSEQAALEEQIKVQGEIVRRLKTSAEKKDGEDVDVELGKLQALKTELKEITSKLAVLTV